MSTYCIHNILKRIVSVMAILLAMVPAFYAGRLRAETVSSSVDDAIVFIDPGHGGQDTGALGANGLSEKDVTLALSKRINDRLARKYVLRFSRSDDYNLPLFRRIETANSQKADLFISLHIGGAFNYSAEGCSVYYFLDSPGRILPEASTEASSIDPNTGRVPWNGVQYGHIAEGRLLAQFLRAALGGGSDLPDCRITGAPLLVLSSAAMPAVVIEVGCLNNPAEAEKLADPEYLDMLADAISSGLENYLSRPPGITSIDLHE